MANTLDISKQSELAFASYASLSVGLPDAVELQRVDMSKSEAEAFARTKRVSFDLIFHRHINGDSTES